MRYYSPQWGGYYLKDPSPKTPTNASKDAEKGNPTDDGVNIS